MNTGSCRRVAGMSSCQTPFVRCGPYTPPIIIEGNSIQRKSKRIELMRKESGRYKPLEDPRPKARKKARKKARDDDDNDGEAKARKKACKVDLTITPTCKFPLPVSLKDDGPPPGCYLPEAALPDNAHVMAQDIPNGDWYHGRVVSVNDAGDAHVTFFGWKKNEDVVHKIDSGSIRTVEKPPPKMTTIVVKRQEYKIASPIVWDLNLDDEEDDEETTLVSDLKDKGFMWDHSIGPTDIVYATRWRPATIAVPTHEAEETSRRYQAAYDAHLTQTEA